MKKTILLATSLLILCACKKDSLPEDETVTDICGNTYKTVTIGSQVWMAENLASTKYDTESERAGELIQEADGSGDIPYFVDSRIKENWTDKGVSAEELSDEQIKKLGLLYNWSAAMGFTAEESWEQKGLYDGDRQGICPNGWHLPSQVEWDELEKNVRTLCGDPETGREGKYLKSSTGWHEGGNGTDNVKFNILPAGGSDGKQIICVGRYAQIWTSTAYNNEEAYDDWLNYNSEDIVAFDSLKKNARSIRCVRNAK